VVDLVLILRVSALYGHCKIITSFLGCLFTSQFAAVVALKVIISKGSTIGLYYEFLPGCWYFYDEIGTRWRYSWWIPFIFGDVILLTLTLAKAYSYRDHCNPIVRLLARDSVLYFVPMLACLVQNIVSNIIPNRVGFVIIPTEWLACIAVSRMMMSIRSLVFNDLLTTQRLEFSTIIIPSRDGREDEHNS